MSFAVGYGVTLWVERMGLRAAAVGVVQVARFFFGCGEVGERGGGGGVGRGTVGLGGKGT